MTTEEAIRWIQLIKDTHSENDKLDKLSVCALNMAISSLRAQVEAERNGPLKTTWETPEICPHCMEHLSKDWSFCPECGRSTDWSKNTALTMEELREMDGEPVWLVTKTYGRWALITCMTKEYVWLTSHDGEERYCISDCGNGFLAYRRKPEK